MVNFVQSPKFQDRRLESDGTMCSENHLNDKGFWVPRRYQISFRYWSAYSVPIGQERDFMWTFLIADVSSPILGAGFLHYFELVPDLRNKCLRDTKTKLQSVGHLKHTSLHSVQISISTDTIYHKRLKEFPSITKLPNPNQPVKHNTFHYIIIKGLPVVAKPRRLAPDRLKIAKTEFQNMMHLEHLRPSKSNYTLFLRKVL
ncbi:transposon Ty3-G Gag-Pol polyprotein [Trichonephila clavipes]|nr:transposon Ty3-G Gag-Pol polyprotein [Trichonephila clavipes]